MEFVPEIDTAIETLLGNQDPGLRYHSAWWLGKMKIKKAVPALCQCLADETDRTALGGYPLRRQAARSLGMIKEKAAIQPLLDSLQCSDPRLQEASILALKAIGDSQATSGLIQFYKNDSDNKPYEALIETLAMLEAWTISDAIEPALQDSSERIKGAASVYFFCKTRDEHYLQPLLQNLSHQNPFIRQSSAFDMAQCKKPELSSTLSESELPNNVKLAVLNQMLESYLLENSLFSDCSADQTVKDLLHSIDLLIPNAIEGNLPPASAQETNQLSDVFSEEQLDELLALLTHSNPLDKSRAIQLLTAAGRMDVSIVIEALEACEDEDIRAGLVQIIYELNDPRTIKALQEIIGLDIANHCQGKLRRVATLALGNIYAKANAKDEQASIVNTLTWALTEPDDWGLRYSAVMAWQIILSANNSLPDPFVGLNSELEEQVVCQRIYYAKARLQADSNL